MKVLTVVGARPQFVKAAPVSRALRMRHEEVLVHTGQHYDDAMSGVFFAELGIPAPDINLNVGSGSHATQTAAMLVPLEGLIEDRSPDVVVVYGDTNTTLAAALAAAKLDVPVAHVEAGLRSFNRAMPEEINRVVVDHVSTLLLCPTKTAVDNLRREGITDGVSLVGDVMLDAALHAVRRPDGEDIVSRLGLSDGDFLLATVHRPVNSDDPHNLRSIVEALGKLGRTVVWPVHPRTRKNLTRFGLDAVVESHPSIQMLEPQPYGATVALLRASAGLLTDSGGMQKEAYFFEVPCVTLRSETEWVETVDSGWNVLVGADETKIVRAATALSRPRSHPELYGRGDAAARVVSALEARFDRERHRPEEA